MLNKKNKKGNEEFFLERYKNWGHLIKKEDIEKIRKEYLQEITIRVNTIKISKKELKKRLKDRFDVEESKISSNILKLKHKNKKFSVASTIEYLLGYFYIQDEISTLPIEIFNWKKFKQKIEKENIKILDASAAPGGKTTYIAQILKNKGGKIFAIDKNAERVKKMCNNLERLGIKNVIVIKEDINKEELIKKFKNYFDMILLDAPCSGNFVVDKEWFKKRKIKDIIKKSEEQKKMISSCTKMLKKGGELIYSTCSLEKEEDENVVGFILKEEECLQPKKIKIKEYLKNKVDFKKNYMKIWPEKLKKQGFFVAKFEKNS